MIAHIRFIAGNAPHHSDDMVEIGYANGKLDRYRASKSHAMTLAANDGIRQVTLNEWKRS